MINTCEEYASEHNLKFSTNPVLEKSKTKCMAFLLKEMNLRKLKLGENELPWWDHGKHLGNKIDNSKNGMAQDLLEKRARYIGRNNELCQEFFFAHPKTLFSMNEIYNSHFTGSPLWDLFGSESKQLEKTWNSSFKVMYGLPRETHTYFVEAISERPHLKTILIKRFMNFIHHIEKSKKIALKKMLNVIKYDTQSVTGKNLREIMLLVDKCEVSDVTPDDLLKIKYKSIPENEEWRIPLLNELIEVKMDKYQVKGFSEDEIQHILNNICIS